MLHLSRFLKGLSQARLSPEGAALVYVLKHVTSFNEFGRRPVGLSQQVPSRLSLVFAKKK